MAHYSQRGKNSWRLIVPLGYNAQGKKRSPATTTIRVEDPYILRAPKRLETHLNDELTKFKTKVFNGEHKVVAKRAFKDFVDFWIENHVCALEHKTRKNYLFHCERRINPYFSSYFLKEITIEHLVKFINGLTRLDKKPGKPGSATLVMVYRILCSIFGKAVQWGFLENNPMDGVDKPEENDIKKPDAYDDLELEQLFDALEKDLHLYNSRYYFERMTLQVLIALDVTTGMRRAELIGLDRDSINWDTGVCEVYDTIPAFNEGKPVIKRPKNDESRKFALSPSIVEVLRDYITIQTDLLTGVWGENAIEQIKEKNNGKVYLFLNVKTGSPLAPTTIRNKWADFHERHPHLKYIPFHGIRHTATSVMIAKNIHARAIANRLGWKSTKMVDHYGKVFASVDQAAAEAIQDVLPRNLTIRGDSKKITTVTLPEATPEPAASKPIGIAAPMIKTTLDDLF